MICVRVDSDFSSTCVCSAKNPNTCCDKHFESADSGCESHGSSASANSDSVSEERPTNEALAQLPPRDYWVQSRVCRYEGLRTMASCRVNQHWQNGKVRASNHVTLTGPTKHNASSSLLNQDHKLCSQNVTEAEELLYVFAFTLHISDELGPGLESIQNTHILYHIQS